MALKIKEKRGARSGIVVFDNALPPELCDDIIDFFNDPQRVTPGRTVGGQHSNVKKTFDGFLETSMHSGDAATTCNKLQLDFFNNLKECVQIYIDSNLALRSQWEQPADTGFQYQRYIKDEGFYSWHYDGGPYREIDIARRVLAVVAYLNTVEEGGQTEFDEMQTSVKAKQGRVLIFPSGFLYGHRSTIPKSSDKHIISTFLTGYTSENYERSATETLNKSVEEIHKELGVRE